MELSANPNLLPIANPNDNYTIIFNKLDLELADGSQIELFSFPNAPKRSSYPEAQGLRHLAFSVDCIQSYRDYLIEQSIEVEVIRIDECTSKKYTFFSDPDGLPLELYEY